MRLKIWWSGLNVGISELKPIWGKVPHEVRIMFKLVKDGIRLEYGQLRKV